MGRRPRKLDPTASAAALFGAKLRKHREAKRLSQDELGSIVYLTGDQISKIELAKRTPSSDAAAAFDRVFGTEDYFQDLWNLVDSEILPDWFRPYVEAEREASAIRSFSIDLVPGIAQTEEYARAMLSVGRDLDEVEELLAKRLERQQILERKEPPWVWLVLDEFVLLRTVGGRDVMKGQIEHLIALAQRINITVQLVPADRGEYAGLRGSVIVLSFDESPDAVYLEDQLDGRLIDQAADVARCQVRFDLIRASALSQEESLSRLRTLLEHHDDSPHSPDLA